MVISTLKILAGLLLIFNFSGAYATSAITKAPDGKLMCSKGPKTNEESTQSFEKYLQYVGAYNLEVLNLEKSMTVDAECGEIYFLEFRMKGFWKDIQIVMDLYVQTLTKESQDRLFDSITKNYAQKGFPKCLLNDQFYYTGITVYDYHYNPDYTTVKMPAKIVPIPPGYACSGIWERPISNCWNVEDPYKDQ